MRGERSPRPRTSAMTPKPGAPRWVEAARATTLGPLRTVPFMSRPTLAVLAIVSLLLVPPQRARAESAAEIEEARALFREGSRLAKEGRWRDAEDRFGRSLARKRAAITLYSLAVAEHRTGRLVEAIAHLRAF